MKKSNLLFVLSAFALVGGMTGCSPTKPSTSTSTSTSTVATKHAVVIPTSVAGAYVTASHSEAVAGDSVKLTVALTDPTNYELKSVKVGEQVLKGTADANNANVFHYSFVMGDADANVSVVTEKIVAPVVEKHAVVVPTSVAGAYVTASRSEAAEGDEVDITVALTDPTNYELKSVKVGDKVLEGKVDANNKYVFHYSVVMGKADVNVSVVTEQIVAPTKDHTISFEGKDLAFALEMPQDANVGEHVSFKVAARSGYEITSVKVVKVSAAASAEEGEEAPKEELVEVAGDPVVGYSFDMPDADVVIKAEALGAYFKVNADDEKTIFQAKGSTSYDSKLKVSSFVYSFIDSEKVEQKTKSSYFRAGSEVTVVAKHNPFAIVNKFFANGVELEKVDSDTANMYKFTMPATNVELSVDPADKKVEVNVDAGEHTSTSLYRIKADKSHEETTFGYPGETLYLDLEINEADAEDYILPSSVSSTMARYNDDKALTTASCNISTTQQSGATNLKATYSILVTSYYTSAGAIEVNAHERYLKQYLGKAFVGQYYGYEIYNSNFYGSGLQLTMGADGSLTIPGSYAAKTDTVVECDDENKTVTLKDRGVAKYSANGSIWFFYDKNKSFADTFFFSKNFASASAIQKRVYAKNNLFIGEFYEKVDGNEVVRASIFMNKNDKTVVVDPTIEMVSGSDISASNAKFLVKDGETLVAAIGIGDEYGTYSNGDSTLVLDGAGVATLDGVTGTYVIDAANKNKVTVTVNETEHVYTIDKSAKTFTDYVGEVKSLYNTFKSTANNNILVLNSDGTGTYNNTAINFTFVESTNKVTFTVNDELNFDLTWDAINGTLIGTFVDDEQRSTDITFNIDVPFYVGTFTGTVYHDTNENLTSQCTLVINPDKKTGTYVHNDDTRTFTISLIGTDGSGNVKITAIDDDERELIITVKESANQVVFNYLTSKDAFHYYEGTLTKQAE